MTNVMDERNLVYSKQGWKPHASSLVYCNYSFEVILYCFEENSLFDVC